MALQAKKLIAAECAPGHFREHYRIGDKLGEGAFSVVHICQNKETNHNFAVKIIRKSGLSEDDLEGLQSEISIMKELDHPHIIKLIEVYNEPTNYYLVQELVNGGELFDRIVSKTVYTEKEARDLVRILLETLRYLHSHEVAHRDLKPENLLLTSADDDADIKIVDFGFAKHTRGNDLDAICGTPDYVAPEILNRRHYGTKCDIWSTGVITFILLGGYAPFFDDNETELFNKIKRCEYRFDSPFWDHISEEAKDLIRRMLTLNPNDRPTANDLLHHAWMVHDDETLRGRDITASLVEFRKMQARRRFKGAVHTVSALLRFANRREHSDQHHEDESKK